MKTVPVATLYIGEAAPAEVADAAAAADTRDDLPAVGGATLIPATGIWNGTAEPTVIMEIVGMDADGAEQLAAFMEDRFKQDLVLVKMQDAEANI